MDFTEFDRKFATVDRNFKQEYRAVGSLGLWRYFKERTWVGQFCRFIKRWLERTLDLFRDTDWQSHSTRLIGKAVVINFLILSLISPRLAIKILPNIGAH